MISVSSVLAFSLFFVSNASSLAKILDRDEGSPALVAKQTNERVLGPVAQLRVTNKVIAPDGFPRSACVYNDQFPGPLIWTKKGDSFSFAVVNELSDNASSQSLKTSVHFHGIFQHESNWADGVPWVTQCPLRQGGRFVQKFNTNQTGTYWYHSHYASQRCAGAQGALVICDPDDPLRYLYDVDDENTVITLSDWYHLLNVPNQVLGLPNTTLINGKGRYPGGPSAPLSVISVQPGLRYRFRVISMACESAFNFSIDGHKLTIIETDGQEVVPTCVDSIPIFAGQRYSVVVETRRPTGNYWMRALSNLPGSTFDGGQNLAIFRYEGAADEDPKSSPGPYENPFNEGDLHPLNNPGAPGIPEIGKADVNLALTPVYYTAGEYFTFGGVAWENPSVPVLLQILSGAKRPSELLPYGSVYTLPPDKIIEISFPRSVTAGSPHPIHLHGNVFDVVRLAGSNATNFLNPVRRDVVSLGLESTDNVTIRFKTNNYGPWFFHCHLEYHVEHGFAVLLEVALNETAYQESRVVPQDWKDLCQY